ncbi:flavodoxin family protein [Geomesophilobacter sediminis]|uniref:Flavodoxin family protein n=1 Tax=Geomesophilobacter sediminis TaxID=2798584 RepID=A0A8J7JF26_9BACT|nr:flavodoxin family protein [Geomesophilobacter sediminis]MBJ6724809.1 flavodoxin family protein [Geomesophilobacter sediminis]
MKIIVINGSPRGMKGMTGRLLEEVVAGVSQAGAEVETVLLNDITIKPCTACDACHKIGHCPVQDDFEPLKKKLLEADGFVLASPNYIFSVTAQMKAFFDRCCGIIHCHELEGKYAALVETSGGGGDDEVLGYMSRFVTSLGAVTVGGVGSVGAGWRTFPEQDTLFAKAQGLGQDLCAAIKEKRVFPEQEEARLAFKARMEQLIGYMGEVWTYEKEFWVSRNR